MNYHCELQPLLTKLRHCAHLLTSVQDGRPSQNSLYYLKEISPTAHPVTTNIKEELIADGKKYCESVQQIMTEICRVLPECRLRKSIFFYSLHHCTLHSITARIIPTILECCRDQIAQFDQARFNCSYFDFNYHPESVLPLSLLQCWNQLITDIRYQINMEIRRNTQKRLSMKSR